MHHILKWFLSGLLCLLCWLGFPLFGQPISWAEPSTLAVSAEQRAPDETTRLYDVIPDWSQFSFDDFGAIATSGEMKPLKRSWTSGQSITSVLNLGDLADSLSPQDFSWSQIGQLSQVNLNQVSADSFPLLTTQKVSTLVEVVPQLGEFSLNEVLPLKTLFLTQNLPESAMSTPLSGLMAQFPDFASSSLSQLPKDQVASMNLADIPNIDIPQLQAFDGWQTQTIAQVPGLSQVPLSSFPNPLATIGSIVARIDMVYSPAENKRHNTISGSDVVGFEARCPDDGILTKPADSPVTPAKCAYIELDDLENQGRKMQGAFEGKQWISGKYQEVRGGHGALANTPGMTFDPGYEPTGRHPFGQFFKQVIWEPDETTDQTSSFLFFRFCDATLGCTPYNQFSVPFLTYPVNSLIFVGALNDVGGASPINSSGGGESGDTTRAPPIARSNPPCVQGVGGSNLADAIAAVESQGSGDYQAIGSYTCDENGLCGVALGRYQTMSYKESVQAIVSSKPGGAAWLESVRQGVPPTQADLLRYYPQEAQEQVYNLELSQLTQAAATETDPTTGQRFTGDRLIERVAQMWYGGPAVGIDSTKRDQNGALTVFDYGVKARQIYQSASKGQQPVNCSSAATLAVSAEQRAQGDGKASGTLTNPSPGSVLTSPYGVPRGDHDHSGIDLAGNRGDPVLAADGGKIGLVGWDAGGYGNFIVVDHGNGTLTLYGHLDSVSVKEGQSVFSGQTIGAQGSTGRSSGPHLHFEVIKDATPGDPRSGRTVDPAPYLNL
jgi:murein DD-endopeptidase MepM/ murein hydrolase activator NlpD